MNTGRGDNRSLAASIVVAALGYFVDLYDIVIFGVVRVKSLEALGITGAEGTSWGITLLNLQMIGMLIGGILWGLIGDRFGRRLALFSTITVFSVANMANGLVTDVYQYAVLRFLAGVGLAGELGAGVTLVSELLPAKYRGYGTTIISFSGLLGALSASYLGAFFSWRGAYFAGGWLGLAVLAGRLFVLRESALFEQRRDRVSAGATLRALLGSPPTMGRFVAVVAVGTPIWYVSALFVNLSPEMGTALHLSGPLPVADALRWQAIGLAIGSAGTGLISEWLHSRRRVVYASLALLIVFSMGMTRLTGHPPAHYMALLFLMGLAQGYWTVFVTLASEQFGTNVRATVTTSIPNFVRAMTVPVTMSLKFLAPGIGFLSAAMLIGAIVYATALLALMPLRETYGRDLDYDE